MERRDPQACRDSRLDKDPGTYVLVVRGLDGRLCFERFDNAAAYRDRLIALEQSQVGSLTIDEIVGLLDA